MEGRERGKVGKMGKRNLEVRLKAKPDTFKPNLFFFRGTMRASSSRYCLSAPCAFFTVRGLRKYCCEILSIFSGLSFRLLAFKNKGKKGSFFCCDQARSKLGTIPHVVAIADFSFPNYANKGSKLSWHVSIFQKSLF